MDRAATTPPVIEDATTDHQHDLDAIRELIADIERGFNTNDPEVSVTHFAQNASAVNVAGVQISGRADLLQANEMGLAGPLRDDFARYELADVVFVRPDVAVAHKLASATTADGQLIDQEPAMVALYVLVKENGRWWVAARQNTLRQTT